MSYSYFPKNLLNNVMNLNFCFRDIKCSNLGVNQKNIILK